MRENEFMAWAGNRWLYFDKHDGRFWEESGATRSGYLWHQVECYEWPIEQFTGLTDRNGKKIYSGDKCNIDGHDELIKLGTFSYSASGSMEDERTYSGFYSVDKDGLVAPLSVKSEIKVIGNIHEQEEQ